MSKFLQSTQFKNYSLDDFESLRRIRQDQNINVPIKFNEFENFRIICELDLLKALRSTPNNLIDKRTAFIALTLHKRFYLKCPITAYHPLFINLGCIFLALKVDELMIHINTFIGYMWDRYCKFFEHSSKEKMAECVRKCEIIILEKLDFKIFIHCPDLSMDGFIKDMQMKWFRQDSKLFDEIRSDVESYLLKAVLADCMFIFSPNALAFTAIFHCVFKKAKHLNFDDYVRCHFKDDQSIQELQASVKEIDFEVKQLDLTINRIKKSNEDMKTVVDSLRLLIPSSYFNLSVFIEDKTSNVDLLGIFDDEI